MKRFLSCLLAAMAAAGCATAGPARKTFDVTVEVDFGPAGKSAVREVVQVEPGATAHVAVKKLFPVEHGAVCCDPRETSSLGGVSADPAANKFWSVSINGSRKVSPYKTQLQPGDLVRWEYKQYAQ